MKKILVALVLAFAVAFVGTGCNQPGDNKVNIEVHASDNTEVEK